MESAKERARESDAKAMESVPKKRKIDDYGWQIFYHASFDNEITDLDIPSIKAPITLGSLLSFCYATDTDLLIKSTGFCSRRDSNSSSDKSESPPYQYDSSPEKLSPVFAQDGKLCIDQILPLLPPAPKPNMIDHLQKYYYDLVACAELALSCYNRENNAQYELVAPLMSSVMYHRLCFFARHINFLAKPKNVDTNAPPDLFFAEVAATMARDLLENPVFKVSMMKPQPRCFSSSGTISVAPLVFHPDDVDCSHCKCNLGGCDSSSDDEEKESHRAFSSDDDVDMHCVFCSDEEKEININWQAEQLKGVLQIEYFSGGELKNL